MCFDKWMMACSRHNSIIQNSSTTLEILCAPSIHPRTHASLWQPQVFFTVITVLPFPECHTCCCCCSVAKLCPTLCDPMDCSTPGFPVLHYLPEFAQTYIRSVSDATQPSPPLSPPSPPTLNLSQHQGLVQWVSSSHQVAKILEL